MNAAKAVQQQQLQAVIKAEVQAAASATAVPSISMHSLSPSVPDITAMGGIALTAALKEVRSCILMLDHDRCRV